MYSRAPKAYVNLHRVKYILAMAQCLSVNLLKNPAEKNSGTMAKTQ